MAENQVPQPRGIVVVGWSDPEEADIGSVLCCSATTRRKVTSYMRAGSALECRAELERLWQRLHPLVVAKMPLDVPPPRGGRFGSPLVLSRVHWVRPEMVVEVSYVEWTSDGLLRHVSIWASVRISRRLRCGEIGPIPNP